MDLLTKVNSVPRYIYIFREGVATVEELKAKILPTTQTAFKKVVPKEPKAAATDKEAGQSQSQSQSQTKKTAAAKSSAVPKSDHPVRCTPLWIDLLPALPVQSSMIVFLNPVCYSL